MGKDGRALSFILPIKTLCCTTASPKNKVCGRKGKHKEGCESEKQGKRDLN